MGTRSKRTPGQAKAAREAKQRAQSDERKLTQPYAPSPGKTAVHSDRAYQVQGDGSWKVIPIPKNKFGNIFRGMFRARPVDQPRHQEVDQSGPWDKNRQVTYEH